MAKLLRVGIIGASSNRGWAKESHVPAIKQLPGLELTAVLAKGQAQADAAVKAFGAKRGYGTATDFFNDAEVDLVAVCVKVPNHYDLVLGALAAGKHVYCEWPLGRTVAEAEALQEAARTAGVHVAIGLQARLNPALRRAVDLVANGAIGRVLSARIYSGTVAFGRMMGEPDLYLEDASNGATLINIHGGHALDVAIAVLGELADVAALALIQYTEVGINDSNHTYQRLIPDYVVTQSHLRAGGVVAVEVAGGRPSDTTFRFEVVGECGTLMLDGAAPRGFQSGRLSLSLNGQPQSVDEGELTPLSDPAFNVGAVYAALRDDITNGKAIVADFGHAVRLTRLISDVSRASVTGTRVDEDHWPTHTVPK